MILNMNLGLTFDPRTGIRATYSYNEEFLQDVSW